MSTPVITPMTEPIGRCSCGRPGYRRKQGADVCRFCDGQEHVRRLYRPAAGYKHPSEHARHRGKPVAS